REDVVTQRHGGILLHSIVPGDRYRSQGQERIRAGEPSGRWVRHLGPWTSSVRGEELGTRADSTEGAPRGAGGKSLPLVALVAIGCIRCHWLHSLPCRGRIFVSGWVCVKLNETNPPRCNIAQLCETVRWVCPTQGESSERSRERPAHRTCEKNR